MNRLSTLMMGTIVASGALVALPTSASAAAPLCTSADLHVSYRPGGAAAGSQYGRMRYRNVSDHACRTGGYGGLSFVGHGDGTQVGAPAARDAGVRVRSFVLHPGQRAISRVRIAETGDYPKRLCRPTRVDGFRVYVPNSHVATYVPYPTKACASTSLGHVGRQLGHQALRKRHR